MSDLEERVTALEARYNSPPPLSNKVFFKKILLPFIGFSLTMSAAAVLFLKYFILQ